MKWMLAAAFVAGLAACGPNEADIEEAEARVTAYQASVDKQVADARARRAANAEGKADSETSVSPADPAPAPATQDEETDDFTKLSKDEIMERIAMTWVKAKLKDPDSAQFRGIVYAKPFMCGHVNAKNGFGGFNGFERFITGSREGTFLESEVPPGEMDTIWEKYCEQ